MTYRLLEGVRVLELGEFISAPYCGKLLADAGAEVTKVEAPGEGDPARRYGPSLNDEPHPERSGLFLYLNSNKRGITLNFGTPTGRGILRELAAGCDVLVHSLPPKDAEGAGLDYAKLRESNPRLVMASITPFGVTGPYRDYKAHDINLAAAGGISEGLGQPDREPLNFRHSSGGILRRHGGRILHRVRPSGCGGDGRGPVHRHRRVGVRRGHLHRPRGAHGRLPVAGHAAHRAPRPGLSLPQLHPAVQGRPHLRGGSGGQAVAQTAGDHG